jgi:hypothetical protein
MASRILTNYFLRGLLADFTGALIGFSDSLITSAKTL